MDKYLGTTKYRLATDYHAQMAEKDSRAALQDELDGLIEQSVWNGTTQGKRERMIELGRLLK